jgi:hypothetical protein
MCPANLKRKNEKSAGICMVRRGKKEIKGARGKARFKGTQD